MKRSWTNEETLLGLLKPGWDVFKIVHPEECLDVGGLTWQMKGESDGR